MLTATLRFFVLLAVALWLGGFVWIGFVLAPYLFGLATTGSPSVQNSGVAADLIGPLLYTVNRITLIAAPALILGLAILRLKRLVPLGGGVFLSELMLLVAFVSSAIDYWFITPKVHDVRERLRQAYGGFHLADKADPLYREFGGLHGASTTLFCVAFAAVLVVFACLAHFKTTDKQKSVA